MWPVRERSEVEGMHGRTWERLQRRLCSTVCVTQGGDENAQSLPP